MNLYSVPPRGFYIGNLEITFYGALISLAMLFGLVVACFLAKKRGLKSDDIILLAVFCFPLAILGARLYYFIFNQVPFSQFFNFRDGGLAILGGVIGGILGVVLFCLVKKNFRLLIDLFDICAPALILGQAIGRVGCFFSQCCYGNLVTNPSLQWFPFAMKVETYVGSGVYTWHLATNLYESLWNLIGFGVVLLAFEKSNKKVISTATYLVWYGFGRAIIESIRGDSLFVGASGVRISQVLSILMFVIGAWILIYRLIKIIKSKRANENKRN